MFRHVTTMSHAGRRLLLLAAIAVGLMTWPLAASATTGRGVVRTFDVTITNAGVTWKPALSTLHPLVGTEFKLTVVNGSSASHWFRLGTVQTKPLAPRTKAKLDFTIKKLGKLTWLTGLGTVTAAKFHGQWIIKLPGAFQ